MCGILFHIQQKPNLNDFKKNLDKISHRGPDNKTFIQDGDMLIGHVRLSIIDINQRSNQPMISECNNYIISYNGEIYNFQEIRKDLIKKGIKFITNSDTEVLLNGYKLYGKDILKKVNGIFAFLIVDKIKNEIFFARDHFGVKPLYYLKESNSFMISSETRVFEDYTEKDEMSKILFLSHGYIPTPKTIFKNVLSLKPGHYGILKNNNIEISEYYDILKIFNKKSDGFKKNYLVSAVTSQMISDAKIGCFLSGGIDSSVISSIISSKDNNLETYSLIFDNVNDERLYQDKMIEKFKFNSKQKKINIDDFKYHINEFISSMDQPTIDGFNTFFVSQLAKENNVKVTFSGIGSDEIFYGYPVHHSNFNKFLIKLIFKFLPLKILPNRFHKIDYLKLENDYGIYLSQRGVLSISEISKLLSISESMIINYLNSFVDVDLKKIDNLNYIDKMGFFEFTKYMEGQLLRDSDTFGMRNSIEIRVPFLDKNLVENVIPIDYRKKTSSKINKELLVKKFINILPKEIYNRNKKGFELPYKKWLSRTNLFVRLSKEDKKIKIFEKAHWSKLWAVNIMKKKYN